MKANYLRAAGAFLIVIGLALIWTGTRKTLTLVINGESSPMITHRLRVIDLLAQLEIYPHASDRLSLSPDTWLVNHDIVQIDQAAQVILFADGRVNSLFSPERKPANLLAAAQVRLFPGDHVLVNGRIEDPAVPLQYDKVFRIEVIRAKNLLVIAGSDFQRFQTTAPTVAQTLAEEKKTMFATDWVSTGFDLQVNHDLEVNYRTVQKLSIQTKTNEIETYSAAPTVGAALAEQGIALQSLDYTYPDLFKPLPEDGKIRLVRVSEQVIIEQEPIAFDSELQPASDVELDQRVTLQAGEYGLLARRLRIRSEDGEEISRKAEAEWIARPAKNRIVGYGTQVVIKTMNTPDGPLEYWRSVSMYATSYSPCRIFTDRCDSYTASGAELKKGIVAVRGYWYRYYGGTQVYVPGYGVGTVADVGGGIPGRFWIDLGYSESDYVSWHQDVTVYFLTPVPDQIPYIVQ